MTEPQNNLQLLLQRLEYVIEKQSELTLRLDRLAETLATMYVPKGEYSAHREANDRRFQALEKNDDTSEAFRRQVVGGFLVGFLMLIVSVALAAKGIGV